MCKRNLYITYYPIRTSEKIASVVANAFMENDFNVKIESWQTGVSDSEALFLIFPILGDNRIPPEVEKWIIKTDFSKNQRCYICISGDFDEDPKHQIILMNEVISLILKKGGNVSYQPLMVDTPFERLSLSMKIWIEKAIEIEKNKYSFQYIPQSEENIAVQSSKPHLISKTEVWRELLQILPQAPSIEQGNTEHKHDFKLSLDDGREYPRSIIEHLDKHQLQRLWLLIDQLPNLVNLKLPFANLKEWPADTPNLYKNLTALDLRGNNFSSYQFLENFSYLKKLNIGANHLEQIPTEVFSLKNLEVLFAYKNRISRIPSAVENLVNLKRLTLYRNRVEEVPSFLAKCKHLKILNVGANPIQHMSEKLMELNYLDEVVLRNCNLKKLPTVISKLNLKTLDLAKNDKLVS